MILEELTQFFIDICTYLQNKFTCTKKTTTTTTEMGVVGVEVIVTSTNSSHEEIASTSKSKRKHSHVGCNFCDGNHFPVLNLDDFTDALEKAGTLLVVVDFFATWCGPCKIIAPKLEEFAERYADKIVVLKVDVDECEELAIKYNISSMPTFVFIKNGEQVDSFSGANADKLEKYITQLTN